MPAEDVPGGGQSDKKEKETGKDDVPAFDDDWHKRGRLRDDDDREFTKENKQKLVAQLAGMGDDVKEAHGALKRANGWFSKYNDWAAALIRAYTMETPLCYKMNMDLLREKAESKFKLYANMLWWALYHLENLKKLKKVESGTTLYRTGKFTAKQIQSFRTFSGAYVQWRAFTSTSKSRALVEAWNAKSGHNVIFEIAVIDVLHSQCFDISALSVFPHEEEVLIKWNSYVTIKDVVDLKDGKFVIKIKM